MTKSTPRCCIVSAEISDQELIINWKDGHRSNFHPMWLRHQCNCASCGTAVTAVRGVRLHHIPQDIAATLGVISDNSVNLIWSNDGHKSRYEAEWLRDHCYSETERTYRKHRPALWDHGIQNDYPSADMVACERSPNTRLAMLEQVRDYGFCLIRNAPTEASQASRLINIVGPQRQTHYGTYILSKKDTVDNVGDITTALDPHIDETYRLSTIGIAVFQVLTPSSNGGHSTLVDGFEAARRFRQSSPEDFELLTQVPIVAERRDAAHNSGGTAKWYSAVMPMIRLDFDDNVSGVRFNERQIAPLDLPGDLIGPCYRALKRLFDILYDPDLRLIFELKAGEGLIFDNQRVLHGRTAFEPEVPARSVLTSSVDIEEFHSSLRILTESVRGHSSATRLTQGMMA
jgi:gamma-butyrobetaine dioxygenase